MLGILSKPELAELTGCSQKPKQMDVLKKMKLRFLVRPDGSIAIARAHVEHELGVSSKNIREPELNL